VCGNCTRIGVRRRKCSSSWRAPRITRRGKTTTCFCSGVSSLARARHRRGQAGGDTSFGIRISSMEGYDIGRHRSSRIGCRWQRRHRVRKLRRSHSPPLRAPVPLSPLAEDNQNSDYVLVQLTRQEELTRAIQQRVKAASKRLKQRSLRGIRRLNAWGLAGIVLG
jgi:hypothetical protein